jgi:quercetin dioxygenase-like cupin family protein
VEGVKFAGKDAKGVVMRVVIGPDQGATNFTMRVFEVAPGGHTPRHHHDFEHEIFVHSGQGEIFYEGKETPVGPGHVAYLAPNAEHQLRNTGDAPFVFVCVIPNRE